MFGDGLAKKSKSQEYLVAFDRLGILAVVKVKRENLLEETNMKWTKVILSILIVLQLSAYGLRYFKVPERVEKLVSAKVVKGKCKNVKAMGMDLPFQFFYKTKYEAPVYLTFEDENGRSSTELTLVFLDPSLPLLKGSRGYSYSIRRDSYDERFVQCFI